jgi:hypothetical protein
MYGQFSLEVAVGDVRSGSRLTESIIDTSISAELVRICTVARPREKWCRIPGKDSTHVYSTLCTSILGEPASDKVLLYCRSIGKMWKVEDLCAVHTDVAVHGDAYPLSAS